MAGRRSSDHGSRRSRQRVPPSARTSPVLWVLVGANVLVYLAWQLSMSDPSAFALMADHFLVSVDAVRAGRVWTLITSAFSHLDPTHLLFNMLALWVFGRDVLPLIGGGRFLAIYLVAGVVASVGHVVFGLVAGDPTPALGASGSVMAFAVLFGALYPRRVLLINFFIPVPAALAVAGYIVLDVLGAFRGGTGIAHAAHLGGALVGLVYFLVAIRPHARRG